MASKKTNSSKSASTAPKAVAKAVVTPIRNTAVPPKAVAAAPAARKTITREQIAVRAFEIYASGRGGSESDNWFRAEQELRGI